MPLSQTPKPQLRLDRGQDRESQPLYRLTGDWTIENIDDCMQALKQLTTPNTRQMTFCGDQVHRLDITGAWLLTDHINQLKQAYIDVALQGFDERSKHFLDQIKHLKDRPEPPAPPCPPTSVMLLKRLDHISWRVIRILTFLGWFWTLVARAVMHPGNFRFRAFIKQCDITAVRAAPIVAFISFLIAIVLAYQGAAQLRRFGAEIFSIDLVTISVLREMGVLLTAIMVAGRSGSAFAAEIGTMKLNEELDALKTTGMEPMEVLVLPRTLALTVMMPLLTFLGDMTSFVGSGLLTVSTTKTGWLLYQARLTNAIHMKDFWIGIGKAPVFGLMIALIGCYHGMAVTNSAESVGRETTNAVVNAIFAVMLADALFSIMFTLVGL